MKTTSLRIALGLCAAVVWMSAPAALAQATLTAGTYSQNFDSMGTSGTAAPTGWSVLSEAGSHDTFSLFQDTTASSPAPGVNPNLTAGALTVKATLTAQTTPSGTSANGLNYGVSAVTGVTGDRALGTSPTGVAAMALELSLTNSTGAGINNVSLNYDIDRLSTTTNNNSVFNSSPQVGVEEFPGYWLYYSLNNGTTWTNVSSLAPTLSGPSGVVVPNSTGVTSVSDSSLALSSTWAAGSTIEFAWVDDNAQSPSPDQLLGLNNVVVQAVPEPSSVLLGLVAMGIVIVLARVRRQQA